MLTVKAEAVQPFLKDRYIGAITNKPICDAVYKVTKTWFSFYGQTLGRLTYVTDACR